MPEKRATSPPRGGGMFGSLTFLHPAKNTSTSPKKPERITIPPGDWYPVANQREAHRKSLASIGSSLTPIDSNTELVEFTPPKQRNASVPVSAAEKTASLQALVERNKRNRELMAKAAESKRRLEKERKRTEKEKAKSEGKERRGSGLSRLWSKT